MTSPLPSSHSSSLCYVDDDGRLDSFPALTLPHFSLLPRVYCSQQHEICDRGKGGGCQNIFRDALFPSVPFPPLSLPRRLFALTLASPGQKCHRDIQFAQRGLFSPKEFALSSPCFDVGKTPKRNYSEKGEKQSLSFRLFINPSRSRRYCQSVYCYDGPSSS